MERIKPLFPLLPLFLMCCACGGGSSRQLQSLNISPAIGEGVNTAFTATGTFNAPPMNVSPAAVSWFVGPFASSSGESYSLSNAAFAPKRCEEANPVGGPFTVVALSPADPAAPGNGKVPAQVMTDLVINRTATSEDGFVAASAQLKCE
jgi:hypothetical protein